MSLINKMLQDLDARGSQAGSAQPSDIRAAAPVRRQLPVRPIAIGASVLVAAMAVAGVFWLKRPRPVAAPVPLVLAPQVAPAVVAPPVAAAPAPAAGNVVTAPMLPLEEAHKIPTQVHIPTAPVAATPVAVAPAKKPAEVVSNRLRELELQRMRALAPMAAPAPRISNPVVGGRDMNSAQRSEAQYRNALAALEEGRMTAAFEALDQALKLNPRHDAARQSLVALLIEAGRSDEAMQQLEQGLALDAAQPTLAMLLARMQIERGNSGVATLLRTLPSATGNADYHAFLAGALQRDARHREAAEQYGAALRTAPEHGVWLMGLGISLQAEKRDREALAAFQRAKASGTLTPPLLSFVERKLQQMGP